MKIIEYVLAKKQKIITPGQNVSTFLTINSHYTTIFCVNTTRIKTVL